MESPRIYVASLSDYNNGRLEGEWFDFSDYSDASELMDAIHDMLNEITEKYNDGEVREEWAVHDYEYIPSTLASEYMGESDFQQIYDVMEVANERGIPIEVLMERVGDTGSDDYQSVAESLMFIVSGNDESDIVYEYENQMGDLGFDFWQNYIYVDSVTERVMYGEDVDRFREDIQYENPDMDEDEVERLAEEMADEEESRRNDDLVGYLEEMGYSDIPNWVSKDYESAWENGLSYDFDVINHDGEMYVFSSNYGIGGVVIGGLVGSYIGYKVAENKYAKSHIRKAKKNVKKLGKTIKSKFDDGGQVHISDEDLSKIKQIIQEERQKNKGFASKVSTSEVFQTIKEHPEMLKLLSFLKRGGKVDSENYQMLRNKVKEIMHHAVELKDVSAKNKNVPAWVVAKSMRASTDLSDITHYMDGQNYGKGGGVDYKEQEINELNHWDNDEIANYLGVSISQVAKDRQRYIREAQSVMMLDSYGEGGGIGFKGLANKVAKRYEGKSVAPKYQGEYGKRYSKSEAQEVGRKVAGKVYYQQQGRKFDDGGGVGKYKVGDRVTDVSYSNGSGEIVKILEHDGYVVQFDRYKKGDYRNISGWNIVLEDKYGSKYENGGNVSGLNDLIYG